MAVCKVETTICHFGVTEVSAVGDTSTLPQCKSLRNAKYKGVPVYQIDLLPPLFVFSLSVSDYAIRF